MGNGTMLHKIGELGATHLHAVKNGLGALQLYRLRTASGHIPFEARDLCGLELDCCCLHVDLILDHCC